MNEHLSRRRAVLFAAAGLPLLATLFQLAAAEIAHRAASIGLWPALSGTPWILVLLLAEAGSFALWMIALGELPLSIAFPLTAVGSVLSIVMAMMVLGEPASPLALVGGAAILGGAWLIVRQGG